MKYTNQKLGNPGICLLLCALLSALAGVAVAQAFGTTTVQGTVYQANGAPGSGTLQLSWPAFTTAANQAVAAGRTTVSIASDGFVSVKLAPNVGAMPAGLFYTAVYHLSDGTTSTEYWVVPAAAQAALAQVRAQVMPAAQAVQAVNKAYVDQSIAQLVQSQVTSSGGSLTGPLYLNGDPVTSPQAATKHYVDSQVGQTLSINGGAANGPLTAMQLGAAYQADQFRGSDFGAKLQACISALDSTYGGSCDARNFAGTLSMASNLSISKGNVTINLPCATIATSSQIVVTAGTRNVTLHGCASRGTSAVSGSQGGTVFMYSGSAAMIQVGDATYAADTLGFHLDNVVVNTTSAAAAAARAITVWRAQEVHLESLYLLGNANQTGITLDGTGNYTGGTFQDIEIGGFQTALNAIGHQVANAATTDWLNASTFVRLHIVCPTSNGNPIAGTTGINLAQGDGNTFTGGDVESCATALHLGTNAQNNTIVGLRNENSTNQVVADAGSAYNNWITGGTMFTGKLTDNGTRNSFLDTFHRSFNALNGDWFGSQQDATITNHYRLGIGSGNERGLLHRYQTDSGYRWTMGLSDATAGAQYYAVLDELNNVNRLSIGQYNTGQGSSNNQTVVNAAGTGAVVLNGSNNAGSGGVVFGSGGPSSTTVATINNAGNAQFNGSLQVSGASTFLNSTSIKNQADAEIDAFLWAGATAPQKESVVYKDFNGNSQWYMVKDTSNKWALNSAVGGVDSLKAYQSNNSGDTYIDAANNLGVVRVNYEPGSGSAFNVYGGSSGSLYASFNGTTGIKFPGLAAGSGKNCVQIDNSGYLSNTGSSCAGSSVGAGTSGQIAYYPGNGSTIAGLAAVPIGSGGTGATSASAALASLGGLPQSGGTLSGPLAGTSASFSGDFQANSATPALTPMSDIRHSRYGAICNGTADDAPAVQLAINAAMGPGGSGIVYIPDNCYFANASGFTNPVAGKSLMFEVQGVVKTSSTFVLPPNANWRCLGKGSGYQFAGGTPTCTVQPTSPFRGTLGTNITSTDTPVTVTPIFTAGSIANLPVNSAITIAGTMTCTMSTVTRTFLAGPYPGQGQTNTNFSIASCIDSRGNPVGLRIPPAAKVVIAGCSDTSFNSTLFSNISDFPAGTIGFRQVGAAATLSDGSCTLTGLNMDSFETVRIESVSGSTVTVRTNHTHSASDVWGEVGMSGTYSDFSPKFIEGLQLYTQAGVALWFPFDAPLIQLTGDSLGGSQYLTSTALEFSSSWGSVITNSNTGSYSAYVCPTAGYGCGDIGPPFTIMYDNLPQSLAHANSAGAGEIGPNTTVRTGIYITPNNGGSGGEYITGPFIHGSVIEEPMWNGITIDNRNNAGLYGTTFDNTLMQDNIVYWSQASFVGMTDNAVSSALQNGEVSFLNTTNMNFSTYNTPTPVATTVNKYFCGQIHVSGSQEYNNLVWPVCPQATVSFSDGKSFVGENATPPVGPTYIPYTTLAAITDPASWGCTGPGCSVTPGQRDPFGGTNAGLITASDGNSAYAGVFNYTGPTSTGDVFLYGMMAKAGPGSNVAYPVLTFATYGTDTFDITSTNTFAPAVNNLFYHSIVGMSIVTSGEATSHAVNFIVYPSAALGGASAYIYDPFVIRIPASANIPVEEIRRWRTTMLHGYIPPSFTGPGFAYPPNGQLVWSNDTTLKRNSAGVLEGNGSLILDTLGSSTSPVCPNGTGGALTTSGCAGAGLTQLTGDVTAGPGSGSVAATLAASGATAGTYTNPTLTVNSKGLITSVTAGSGGYGFLNGQIIWCQMGSGPSMNCLGDYVAVQSGGTGAMAGSSTQPMLVGYASATTTNAAAGWAEGNTYNPIYAPAYPLIKWGLAWYGSTDYTTTSRIQLGPTSCLYSTMNVTDTPACSYVQIQHSTARGDTNYKCVSDNGSGSPTITDIGVAPTTAFTQMSISYGASGATCTVGGTSVTNTTKIPTGGLNTMFMNTNTASAAVHIHMFGWTVVHQNRAY